MAIADVHALPETEAACTEYLTEGDQAWDGGDADRAYELYHSLFMSHQTTPAQRSHAAFRLGATLLNRGERDAAFGFLRQSQEPGAHELLQSIDNSTPNDPTPDPDVVPTTLERCYDWNEAGRAAESSGDHDRAARFFLAVAACQAAPETMRAKCEASAGENLIAAGHADTGRMWIEQAMPRLSGDDSAQHFRDVLAHAGGPAGAAADDTSSQAAHQVSVGVGAYESGDATAARTAFEAALHLDGPDDAKGRAHYYLGAMDYQAGHYAQARNHVEAAVEKAPDPEKGWAHAMLGWRWDEVPEIPPNPY